MGKIVGRLLEDRGIPFLYHFGDMKASEREKNLRDFESKDKVKVIVSFRTVSPFRYATKMKF